MTRGRRSGVHGSSRAHKAGSPPPHTGDLGRHSRSCLGATVQCGNIRFKTGSWARRGINGPRFPTVSHGAKDAHESPRSGPHPPSSAVDGARDPQRVDAGCGASTTGGGGSVNTRSGAGHPPGPPHRPGRRRESAARGRPLRAGLCGAPRGTRAAPAPTPRLPSTHSEALPMVGKWRAAGPATVMPTRPRRACRRCRTTRTPRCEG